MVTLESTTPPAPVAFQVTVGFTMAEPNWFATAAVNVWVCPTGTVAEPGDTLTVAGVEITVTPTDWSAVRPATSLAVAVSV